MNINFYLDIICSQNSHFGLNFWAGEFVESVGKLMMMLVPLAQSHRTVYSCCLFDVLLHVILCCRLPEVLFQHQVQVHFPGKLTRLNWRKCWTSCKASLHHPPTPGAQSIIKREFVKKKNWFLGPWKSTGKNWNDSSLRPKLLGFCTTHRIRSTGQTSFPILVMNESLSCWYNFGVILLAWRYALMSLHSPFFFVGCVCEQVGSGSWRVCGQGFISLCWSWVPCIRVTLALLLLRF